MGVLVQQIQGTDTNSPAARPATTYKAGVNLLVTTHLDQDMKALPRYILFISSVRKGDEKTNDTVILKKYPTFQHHVRWLKTGVPPSSLGWWNLLGSIHPKIRAVHGKKTPDWA